MPTLRLFAQAREAAGTRLTEIDGSTVHEVLAAATLRFGEEFARVAAASNVWVNGSPAAVNDFVGDLDEVAILPPVSGGAA